MSVEHAIEINGLSYQYNKSQKLLNNISLAVPEQTITTILGKNGVGKTTLLNCLLKFIDSYEGTISFYGKRQSDYSRKELASVVGLVPQLSQVEFDYTVEEFVLMGCNPSMQYFAVPDKSMYALVDKSLDILEISHLKDRLVNSLSGGERQLVYIARTLTQNPKIIILDEPTSALDFGNSLKILRLLKKLRNDGYTIVLTCHNPDYPFILQGYTIAMMPDGQTQFGESEKVLTSENLTTLYGVNMERIYLKDQERYICVESKNREQ